MTENISPPNSIAHSNLARALDAIDRSDSPTGRVKAAADALYAFGFDRVLITLRDSALTPTLAVTAGPDESANEALLPLPGVVWRKRLSLLDRFRVGDLHVLDGSDAWVAREFFGAHPTPRAIDPTEWLPTDLIVGLIRGTDGDLLGIIKLTSPRDGKCPDERVRQEIGWLVRHLGARIAHDTLRVVANRRAERLQRLQEAGAALARSLDEREIIRELARQAVRATNADGVVIAIPDLEEHTLVTRFRVVRGTERPRNPMELGDGVIAEVARTGKPVRLGDRGADRLREQSGAPSLSSFDVVGDAGPASSVLAVPLIMGIRLIAVVALHAAPEDVFSPEDEEVIATMASQAATAIANARRYAESEQQRRQTEALADVARAVGESLRPGEVLRLIMRHAVALLGAEGAGVALRTGEYMHIVAAVGAASVLAGVHLPVGTSVMGRVATIGERIVSNDYANDSLANPSVSRIAPIKRTVIAPLTTARGTIGVLAVINRETPFTEEDGRILQRLADHVAVAIVNAQLFEEIERATREWKAAFDCIATGMVVLDEAQRISRCNARSLELCNAHSYTTILGQRFPDALLGEGHNAESGGLDALIDRAVSSGMVTHGTVLDERHNRLFEVSASPHPDGGLVVTFDDLNASRHHTVNSNAQGLQ
ncbi:MAG: GAF domain-containing protein [Gemmatimonadaceae bacterium]